MYQIAIGFTLSPRRSVTTAPFSFSSQPISLRNLMLKCTHLLLSQASPILLIKGQLAIGLLRGNYTSLWLFALGLLCSYLALLQSSCILPSSLLLPAQGDTKLWVSGLLICMLADENQASCMHFSKPFSSIFPPFPPFTFRLSWLSLQSKWRWGKEGCLSTDTNNRTYSNNKAWYALLVLSFEIKACDTEISLSFSSRQKLISRLWVNIIDQKWSFGAIPINTSSRDLRANSGLCCCSSSSTLRASPPTCLQGRF